MDDGEFTMIENNYVELGKRAAACKSWRWMPGMRTVRDDGHGFHIGCTVAASKVKPEWLPDLTDPATLGCLLALVRAAWGDPHASVGSAGWDDGEEGWVVVACSPTSKWSLCDCKTEAEALVAALEAAP